MLDHASARSSRRSGAAPWKAPQHTRSFAKTIAFVAGTLAVAALIAAASRRHR